MESKELCDILIGISKENGISKCSENGFIFRISKENGISYFLTQDLRFDRVNVVIDSDVIISAEVG